MVLRLTTSPLRYIIAIQKLNHIRINCLIHLWPSVLPDKWRFDNSQDWELIKDDFDSVSLDPIPNGILQALGFHLSLLSYHEKRALQFLDGTDKPELAFKPDPGDKSQLITDFKDEKLRKKLEHATKKKARCDNLYTSIWAPVTISTDTLLSHPRLPIPLSSCC